MTDTAPEPRWVNEEAAVRYLGGDVSARTLRQLATPRGIRGRIGRQVVYDVTRLDELVQLNVPPAADGDGSASQE